MKRFLIFLLFISIGFKIYFLVRKIERIQKNNGLYILHNYKDISYNEGYQYFVNELQTKYSEFPQIRLP